LHHEAEPIATAKLTKVIVEAKSAPTNFSASNPINSNDKGSAVRLTTRVRQSIAKRDQNQRIMLPQIPYFLIEASQSLPDLSCNFNVLGVLI